LGQGGDFTVNSTDPNLWFSHQHDVHYIDDSTLILFDNGDTRRASDPQADSRGQVWKIDEKTLTATLVVNVDLGNYSDRVGSAQVLSNGDYVFTSGAQGTAPHFIGQSIEVRPDGTKAYVLQVSVALYRSFRVQTLYEGTDLAVPSTRRIPNDHDTGDPDDDSLRGDGIRSSPSLGESITRGLDIEGLGPEQLTVSDNDASRNLDTSSGVAVIISGLRMADSVVDGSSPVLARLGETVLDFGSLTLSDDMLTVGVVNYLMPLD
jgi:hypothetical protein